MKAAVLFKANTPLEIVDLTQAGPARGRGARAGQGRGRLPQRLAHHERRLDAAAPMVLGHEAAGIVEEVGAGVANGASRATTSSSRSGRTAGAASTARSAARSSATATRRRAGACSTARHACRTRARTSTRWRRIGTFSEQRRLPGRDAGADPPRHAAGRRPRSLGCCVPTGVGAVTRCAEVEAGASVLVIGCGGVGLNVVQGARLAARRHHRGGRSPRQQADVREGVRRDPHVQRVEGTNVVEPRARADGGPRRRLRFRRHRRRGDDAPDPRRDPPGRHRGHRRHGGHEREGAHRTLLHGAPGENHQGNDVRLGPAEHRLPEARRSLPRRPPQGRRAGEPHLHLDQINEGFAAMRTGQVARGVVVFN